MPLAINIDTRSFERGMREFKRQIPFATALALTRLAQDGQAALKAHLGDDFTIRSPWVAKGVRIKRAEKRTLKAVVGSTDQRMAEQVTGATLENQSVPTVGRGSPRPKITSKTPRSKWPKQLAAKALAKAAKKRAAAGQKRAGGDSRLPFFVEFGSGHRALVRRKTSKRLPLHTLYHLHTKVKIPARWKIEARVRHEVGRKYDLRFSEAMARAISTARSRR